MKLKQIKSTRQLIMAKTFSKYGLITNMRGELAYFKIRPTNISVLSKVNIETKIRHLMMVLSSISDVEICCTDSCECFDDNKIFLNKRIEEEENPLVKFLLREDAVFLDSMQIEMSTARDFMFVIRFRNEAREQVFNTINTVEKLIKDQGFEVHRATREEIKRMLAIYFEQNVSSDYNNERWLKADAICEEE